MLILDVVMVVSIGLLIGIEFAVSVFVNPVVWRLEEVAEGAAIRMFATRLGRSMPFWYGANLLLLIAEAIVRRHESGAWLLKAAGAIWLLVIVLTILFLVPINNRMMRLDAGALSGDDRMSHKKWDMLHRLRVAALIASMICALLAILP